MSIQSDIPLLEKLLDLSIQDVDANASEIVRIYHTLAVKNENPENLSSIPFLNELSNKLLNPQVLATVKRHRIDAFQYLLVANNLLDFEDIKDDLLHGDVLKQILPANAIRKLKSEVGIASVVQQPVVGTSVGTKIDADRSRENPCRDDRRLPYEIRNRCVVMKQVNGMILYQLPLRATATFPEAPSILKRFTFGEENPLNNAMSKTILLMGATGSGKTTMINAMVNYILGVEWDDPFRFVLVDEDIQGGSQAFSQTRGVSAYDIHYRDGFRIPYSLTIVDTPGFGDTEGIERDREITSSIKKFFEHRNGIQVIDAVGFVVQSSLARLTASQTYIFNSVLSIFGEDIGDNVRFLTTFSDGRQPIVLTAIQEAKLPCKLNTQGLPSYQSFNNGSIFVSNQSDDDRLSPLEWEYAMKNFRVFFRELSKMSVKSLQMTKEVLKSRECLNVTIAGMEAKIQVRLSKMEELRTIESQIQKHEYEIDENINFEIEVVVNKESRVVVEEMSAMNCSNCNTTCHYPCDSTMLKNFCPAFWKFENLWNIFFTGVNISCRVCPGKCPSSSHVNEDTRWGYVKTVEKQTLYDVRKKYEDALNLKLSAEGLKNALKTDLEQVKNDILKDIQEVTRYSNLLKKIALRSDPLSAPEYIQLMIDNEFKERKNGYKERIQHLEGIRKKAVLAHDIVNCGDEWDQFFDN